MNADKTRAAAHYTALADQAAQLGSSGAARIPACAVMSITPQQMRLGAMVLVDLALTPAQRWGAVAELLSTGMSEQDAYEGLRAMFPAWFEQVPA